MCTLNNKSLLIHELRVPKSSVGLARNEMGVTLVDLLVGITIGFFVVMAAIGSLSFVKASAITISEASRLQQRADAIFRNIGFQLAQAGSIEMESASSDAKVRFSSAFTGFRPAATGARVTGSSKEIYSIHGVNGAGTATDTLRVSYQKNATSLDCIGNGIDASLASVDSEFSVSEQELRCNGFSGSGAQSIGSGVEDFQVSYGVLSGTDFKYYRADEMLGYGLVPNWANVQAVSMCLQLVSETKGNPSAGSSLTGCRGQTIANDGRIRRVFQRVFSLRNSL